MRKLIAKHKQIRTKMKNILLLLTLTSLLLASSCGKEKTEPIDTASMKISFKATYDGQPLVLNTESYNYNGRPVRFSKINFYISDLVVLSDLGERELSEIYFVDLTKTHSSLEQANKGTEIEFSRIPVGDYSGLKFGVGVAADLNRTTPSDYSTSHPLGADNSGEYWDAWDSYIFAKIEGQYDLDDNGFDGNDIAFAYHTGMDRVYTSLELDNQNSLKAGETANINFELDIKQLFAFPNGDLLELEQHDPNNQIEEMIIIMKNFKKALTFN